MDTNRHRAAIEGFCRSHSRDIYHLIRKTFDKLTKQLNNTHFEKQLKDISLKEWQKMKNKCSDATKTIMIATQQIKTTTAKPVALDMYETVNVLKWNNSKWKRLCPYLLETDGEEVCANPGGVLFENFYQGCKVYDVLHENEVYPSRYHMNKPAYLWWKFTPMTPTGDVLIDNSTNNKELNRELYFRWRNSLWACKHPIRYPNRIHRRKNTQFALCIDQHGNERRLNYLETRKEIYVKEYIRLCKKLPEYKQLLEKLKRGENILICEMDVPAINKRGEYGNNKHFCDEHGTCHMSIELVERLLEDPSEAFGHGLCLAYSLLIDLANNE